MYITRHTKYFSVKVYSCEIFATKSCRGNRVTASESPQDRGLQISIVIHDPSYATGLSLRYRKQDAWILS